MNDADWKIWIAKCDELIRTGRLAEGAAMLSALEVKSVPRERRLEISGLCRRVNLLNIGLRLLTPVVHGRMGESIAKASAEEWAEYAVLLQRSGGVREALNILRRPGIDISPQAKLYTAFCHFNLWQYEEAIPFLEAYVRSEIPAYARLTGNTNLAAALIFAGRPVEGASLALANARAAAENNNLRLQVNNLELLAQSHFESGMHAEADGVIGHISDLLAGSGTTDRLFIRKWQAAIQSATTGQTEPLKNFREEALAARHFESVREADLLALKVRFDEERFRNLYFGTPLEGYRRRIEAVIGKTPAGDSHAYGRDGAALNLLTGELTMSAAEFPVGSKTHQCVEVLMRDRYKPLSVGALFSELFPGEYFDIDTSPNRVHQVISRTRQWLEENGVPLKLEESAGRYSITPGPNFRVIVAREPGLARWESVQLRKLRSLCTPGRELTAGEIRELLSLTPANFKRFTKWAVEHGELVKRGVRAATKYRAA